MIEDLINQQAVRLADFRSAVERGERPDARRFLEVQALAVAEIGMAYVHEEVAADRTADERAFGN